MKLSLIAHDLAYDTERRVWERHWFYIDRKLHYRPWRRTESAFVGEDAEGAWFEHPTNGRWGRISPRYYEEAA